MSRYVGTLAAKNIPTPSPGVLQPEPPHTASVVHLDVEDCSEELLQCLSCHKESARRIQIPLRCDQYVPIQDRPLLVGSDIREPRSGQAFKESNQFEHNFY